MIVEDIMTPIIFGWPAVGTALILAAGGILTRKGWMVVIGGLVVGPFAWYLTATAAFRILGWLLPALLFGAALAVESGRPRLAWLLLAPWVGIVGWVAFLVLNQ